MIEGSPFLIPLLRCRREVARSNQRRGRGRDEYDGNLIRGCKDSFSLRHPDLVGSIYSSGVIYGLLSKNPNQARNRTILGRPAEMIVSFPAPPIARLSLSTGDLVQTKICWPFGIGRSRKSCSSSRSRMVKLVERARIQGFALRMGIYL